MTPPLRKYTNKLKSWKSADRILGEKDSKMIANNTELVRQHNSDIDVLLHNNRIITYKQYGDIVLTDAGWATSTTKDRLNRYTPEDVSIKQEDGKWWVKRNGREQEFRNRMVI